MKKSTQTILWVLGGLAVVGGGGAAIYFATRDKEPTPLPPSEKAGSTPNPAPTSGPPQTTSPEVNAVLDTLQHLSNLFPSTNLSPSL